MSSSVAILLATPQSDSEIAQRERAKGAAAAQEGLTREACPWQGGLCQRWWLEGFDNPLGSGGQAF